MSYGSKSIQTVVTIGDDDVRLTKLISDLLLRGRIDSDAWRDLTFDQRDHAIRAYIALLRKKADEGISMSWTDAIMEYVHDGFMRNFLLHFVSKPLTAEDYARAVPARVDPPRTLGRPIDTRGILQAPKSSVEDKK